MKDYNTPMAKAMLLQLSYLSPDKSLSFRDRNEGEN